MALYLAMATKDGLEEVGPFHIGTKDLLYKRFNGFSGLIIAVKEIQADGDELEAIKQQFSNIPSCTNRVVKYRGDIADFIFWNLKL